MALLALIPARGGSKGIVEKNLTLLNGLPLIDYTINAAVSAMGAQNVYLSTDDEKILKHGQDKNIQTPFLRPNHLGQDDTLMSAVIKHFFLWAKENSLDVSDGIILLQPTSPLRDANDILAATEIFMEKSPYSLVSVTNVPHQFIPESLMVLKNNSLSPLKEDGALLRQEKPQYFARNGPAILILSEKAIMSEKFYDESVIPYIMPQNRSFDIDTKEDLEIISKILEKS